MAKKPSAEDYIIDFSKADDSGGRVRVKPGTYKVKIAGVKLTTSQGGRPGLQLLLKFTEGAYAKRNKKMTETLWSSPKAYSRFRGLMEAVELKVPKGTLDLRKLAAKLKDKELAVEIVDEKSEEFGTRSVVSFDGFRNVEDIGEDDAGDEDDEDDDDEDVDDEADEDDEDDNDDDDDDEDEEDEDEEPVKPQKKAAKKGKKKKDEDDEDIDLEDF